MFRAPPLVASTCSNRDRGPSVRHACKLTLRIWSRCRLLRQASVINRQPVEMLGQLAATSRRDDPKSNKREKHAQKWAVSLNSLHSFIYSYIQSYKFFQWIYSDHPSIYLHHLFKQSEQTYKKNKPIKTYNIGLDAKVHVELLDRLYVVHLYTPFIEGYTRFTFYE